MNKPKRKRTTRMFQLALAAGLVIVLNDAYIQWRTAAHLYDNVADIPYNEAALVLGTSKQLSNGNANLYFTYRMEAAAALYHNGKVKHIIVSGDNSIAHYNEPADMEADLIARGVPAANIHKDYAGFRTLDSVVRAKAIFGQQRVTCVSQPFHNARAVYIGRHRDVEMVAFNARDVPAQFQIRVRLREYIARMKVQWDILTGKQPRFLGDTVSLG